MFYTNTKMVSYYAHGYVIDGHSGDFYGWHSRIHTSEMPCVIRGHLEYDDSS